MQKSKWKLFTLVSTLPPLVGISSYTVGLLKELDKMVKGEVFSFRKLYPSFLFPGEQYDYSSDVPEFRNIDIYRIIDWYNPVTWILPALKMESGVLHLQWWSPATGQVYLPLITAAKVRKKKIVMTVHNVMPHEGNPIYKAIWKMITGRGDAYIVHSERNREELLDLFPEVIEKPVEVIHHGIEIKRRIDRNEARRILRLPSNSMILLFFGTVRKYKGLDMLIRAFSKVRGDIFLLVAGKPWIEVEEFRQVAERVGVLNRVRFDFRLIPEREVVYYFSAADLVVLPYLWFSSQSGVASLAVGYGVPLIVSKAGGLVDFAHAEAVFETGDEEGLAGLLQKFYDDESYRRELQRDVEEKRRMFSYHRAAEKTVEFYHSLMNL